MFERIVPFESAGRQNHALARRDCLLLSVAINNCTGHPAFFDAQPVAAAPQHGLDTPFEAGPEQSPDQRLPPAAQILLGALL